MLLLRHLARAQSACGRCKQPRASTALHHLLFAVVRGEIVAAMHKRQTVNAQANFLCPQTKSMVMEGKLMPDDLSSYDADTSAERGCSVVSPPALETPSCRLSVANS